MHGVVHRFTHSRDIVNHRILTSLEPERRLLLGRSTSVVLLSVLIAYDVLLPFLSVLLITLGIEEVEHHGLDCRLLLGLAELFKLCISLIAVTIFEDDDILRGTVAWVLEHSMLLVFWHAASTFHLS